MAVLSDRARRRSPRPASSRRARGSGVEGGGGDAAAVVEGLSAVHAADADEQPVAPGGAGLVVGGAEGTRAARQAQSRVDVDGVGNAAVEAAFVQAPPCGLAGVGFEVVAVGVPDLVVPVARLL